CCCGLGACIGRSEFGPSNTLGSNGEVLRKMAEPQSRQSIQRCAACLTGIVRRVQKDDAHAALPGLVETLVEVAAWRRGGGRRWYGRRGGGSSSTGLSGQSGAEGAFDQLRAMNLGWR